jgi:hypothetical protein
MGVTQNSFGVTDFVSGAPDPYGDLNILEGTVRRNQLEAGRAVS